MRSPAGCGSATARPALAQPFSGTGERSPHSSLQESLAPAPRDIGGDPAGLANTNELRRTRPSDPPVGNKEFLFSTPIAHNGCTVGVMEETLEAWFIREILAHEEALVRYLSRHWPKQDEILDLRQETYIRVYETAHVSRPLTPRAFLFTTARNL